MNPWANRLAILTFSAFIAAPMLWVALQRVGPPPNPVESRPPAEFPTISPQTEDLKRFPQRFEAWFQDRLPLRDSLLEIHAMWKVRRLGISSCDKVILGADGWHFLDEEKSEASARTGSPSEQSARWRQAFRLRGAWLKERGINYLVVLTPEKHDIYPEKLPASRRRIADVDAADQLVAAMQGDAEAPILDLRPVLRRARSVQTVYHRTDTHWNDYGALAAYREIVARLGMQPRDADHFDRTPIALHGDLQRMLHLPDAEPESVLRLVSRKQAAMRLPEVVPLDPRLCSPPHLTPQVWRRDGAGLPRAVLLHDSFADPFLVPALAEHFAVMVSAPTASFVPEVIDHYRPNVVIQQIVTRKINWHVPPSPRGF